MPLRPFPLVRVSTASARDVRLPDDRPSLESTYISTSRAFDYLILLRGRGASPSSLFSSPVEPLSFTRSITVPSMHRWMDRDKPKTDCYDRPVLGPNSSHGPVLWHPMPPSPYSVRVSRAITRGCATTRRSLLGWACARPRPHSGSPSGLRPPSSGPSSGRTRHASPVLGRPEP